MNGAVFHETVADGSIIPEALWHEAWLAVYPLLWTDDESEISHEELLSVLIENRLRDRLAEARAGKRG
jgi:hypothetical protein